MPAAARRRTSGRASACAVRGLQRIHRRCQVVASPPKLRHPSSRCVTAVHLFSPSHLIYTLSPHTSRCQTHRHTNTTTPPSAPSCTAQIPATPPSVTPSPRASHAQVATAAAHAAANAGWILPERQTRTRAAYRHGNSCASPCPWAGARSRGQWNWDTERPISSRSASRNSSLLSSGSPGLYPASSPSRSSVPFQIPRILATGGGTGL